MITSKAVNMEDNRGEGGRVEEDMRTNQAQAQKGKAFPREFEGMNFEQQRGSYKNSDRGPVGEDSDRQEQTLERR
jgi:hypothetical protein